VALDLDGTLVDSAPDLCYCLGVALGSVGLPPPSLADTTSWIGDGVAVLVRRGLTAGLGEAPSAAMAQAALAEFMDAYGRRLFVASRLYPGVLEGLSALSAARIVAGCVTNKPEKFALEVLELAGIGSMLQFVFGGDTFAAKKPDPEPLNQAAARYAVAPAEAAMVGDSVNDSEAARRAGFRFVLARYGYVPPGDKALEQQALSIDRFDELPQLLCAQQTRKYHSEHNKPRGNR
jgi:phosphoglycolate phosphatase